MFIYCSFCTPNIIHTHFYRQNAVVGMHREKIPAMDSTLAYSHCWDLRDVQLMLLYHDKKRGRGTNLRLRKHALNLYQPG